MHIKSRFCLLSPFIIFRLFGIEVFSLPCSPFPTCWIDLQPLYLFFFVTVILNLSFKCCFLPLFYLVPCSYYFFICCPYSVSGLSYFKNNSVDLNISVNFFPSLFWVSPSHTYFDWYPESRSAVSLERARPRPLAASVHSSVALSVGPLLLFTITAWGQAPSLIWTTPILLAWSPCLSLSTPSCPFLTL